MADSTGFVEEVIAAGGNYPALAQKHYGDWTQYPRIVDANPQFSGRPPHTDTSYTPPVKAPTLYKGDVVYVPIDPAPPLPEEGAGIENNSSGGKKEFRKAGNGRFGIKTQFPNPKVEIFTGGNPDKADLTYEGLAKDGVQSNLLGYTFSEGVEDLEGSFSITVENEKIGGRTSYDSIPLRSVVKIYEADDKNPAFIGIIKRRQLKSSMTGQGPKRTIMFMGKSIISVISEYAVSMDLRIAFTDPEKESRQLTENLSKKELSIKSFMKETWDDFFKQGEANTESAASIKKIIEDFIGGFDSFVSGDNERTLHYNITGAFYSEGNNTIDQLWRNVLPQPLYEIFAYCDRDTGKPMIKAREEPFGFPDTDNQDWHNLDIYEIDPLDLIDYDINQSDEEVYNVFMSYLLGSPMSHDFYLGSQSKQEIMLVKDEAKLSLYGYKPLQVSFRGYDKQGAETDSLEDIFKKLAQKTRYWYGRLDEMFSGTITVITDFIKDRDHNTDRNPRIGCRARFLGGEFYINKADHRWNYGGTPTVTLAISRGMIYTNKGYQVSGGAGVLSDIGKQFKELERQ
ncbi:MAG: hypothetical protein LBQ88_17330 [Treponema sp.]|jgi:hypothetical protein|nr:hypothetical protein [Treponema sp.]